MPRTTVISEYYKEAPHNDKEQPFPRNELIIEDVPLSISQVGVNKCVMKDKKLYQNN